MRAARSCGVIRSEAVLALPAIAHRAMIGGGDDTRGVEADAAAVEIEAGQFHAAALGSSTLLSFASSDSFSMRQCGIELDVFQLETVEGGTPRASATATVPPRSTMNCEMVCMAIVLRKP